MLWFRLRLLLYGRLLRWPIHGVRRWSHRPCGFRPADDLRLCMWLLHGPLDVPLWRPLRYWAIRPPRPSVDRRPL